MSALVTGAAGFIGRRLVSRLAAGGSAVWAMARGPVPGVPGRWVTGDVTRPGAWSKCFAGVDTVYHLAGKAHALSEVRQDDAEYFRVNAEGTRNVLEAAKSGNVRRFVFFSSVKAMSRDPERRDLLEVPTSPADELGAVEPDTPYGRSKLAAEKLVLGGGFVPEPVVLRLCLVYGPGVRGNVEKLLTAVRHRRIPPLPDVPNRRSMVHVEDVVTAALLAAAHPAAPGEVFIVSDGQGYSTRQIVAAMQAALGRPVPSWALPVWVLRAAGCAGDFVGKIRGRRAVFDSASIPKLFGSAWFSSAKIDSRLGFRPQWDLQRALPGMVGPLQQSRMRNVGRSLKA